jgi:hypothetical protein
VLLGAYVACDCSALASFQSVADWLQDEHLVGGNQQTGGNLDYTMQMQACLEITEPVTERLLSWSSRTIHFLGRL